METVVRTVRPQKRGKILTTFVPLAPEKILVDKKIDLLVGLFHVMWEDMPRPMTYRIRLADLVAKSGNYLGSQIECGFPERHVIEC